MWPNPQFLLKKSLMENFIFCVVVHAITIRVFLITSNIISNNFIKLIAVVLNFWLGYSNIGRGWSRTYPWDILDKYLRSNS